MLGNNVGKFCCGSSKCSQIRWSLSHEGYRGVVWIAPSPVAWAVWAVSTHWQRWGGEWLGEGRLSKSQPFVYFLNLSSSFELHNALQQQNHIIKALQCINAPVAGAFCIIYRADLCSIFNQIKRKIFPQFCCC